MSDLILLYMGFSWLFMAGSALADDSNLPWYVYAMGVIAAPVTMPFAIGFAATNKG